MQNAGIISGSRPNGEELERAIETILEKGFKRVVCTYSLSKHLLTSGGVESLRVTTSRTAVRLTLGDGQRRKIPISKVVVVVSEDAATLSEKCEKHEDGEIWSFCSAS